MNVEEIPLIIQCQTSPLIGILHKPQHSKKTGIIFVPAGGPQYRAGLARQFVSWSRRLAKEGYPVLRFDYRGFGDSAGEFKGFEHIDEDISSAVKKLEAEISDIDSLVLWGECNAASAIMMYAWREPRIKALIMQNPWVRDETTQARTYIKHYYLMRIMQKSFWLKFFKFQFNVLNSFKSLIFLLKQAIDAKQLKDYEDDFVNLTSFQDKMREGLARFNGKVLLFMNKDSMTGKEFDELVSISARWQTILKNINLTRIQYTFFTPQGEEIFIRDALQWLDSYFTRDHESLSDTNKTHTIQT